MAETKDLVSRYWLHQEIEGPTVIWTSQISVDIAVKSDHKEVNVFMNLVDDKKITFGELSLSMVRARIPYV